MEIKFKLVNEQEINIIAVEDGVEKEVNEKDLYS